MDESQRIGVLLVEMLRVLERKRRADLVVLWCVIAFACIAVGTVLVRWLT